jgi:hypothetical protein
MILNRQDLALTIGSTGQGDLLVDDLSRGGPRAA